MPYQSYAIFLAFTILGVATAVQVLVLRSKGIHLVGKPTIDPFYFYTGKVSLYACWLFFFIKATLPSIGYITLPEYAIWLSIGLLYAGSLLLVLSLYSMGKSLTFGLPEKPVAFITRGLYRYSRNPVYVSMVIICIASCICFPDLLNVSFAAYGIVIHHSIIKGEETYLERKHGKEYVSYSNRVHRYL